MVIVETRVFTKKVETLLTDDDYRCLQDELVSRPDAGKIIPGSGGLRKLRWAGSGRGKRGGVRVIYYVLPHRGILLMLLMYSKKESRHKSSRPCSVIKLCNSCKSRLPPWQCVVSVCSSMTFGID